jgi:hypothetical protein
MAGIDEEQLFRYLRAMMKNALVTLAVGRDYDERFERLCRPNWTAYAERHGLDLLVFKHSLDESTRAQGRSPAWQKCLILGVPEIARYERVAWVDSDIIVNPAGPSLFDAVPAERIGVTDEHAFPHPEIRQALLRKIIESVPDAGEMNKRFWRAWQNPSAWHEYSGLPGGQKHIVQTGVMVLSPKHHRALLEHVYHAYEDRGSKAFNYEMRPLSHEIQKEGFPHFIDPRFNALVWWLFLFLNPGGGTPTEEQMRDFLKHIYERSHFLHFAGAAHLMPLLSLG